MKISDQERSVRRRILFGAMNGNATPAAIRTAIATLDDEFGQTENLRFNQVITRLQQTLDATEVNLGKVLGNIMTLRNLPVDKLGPDPATGSRADVVIRQRDGGESPKPVTVRGGAGNVFGTLIETIVSHLRHRGDGSHVAIVEAMATSPEVVSLGDRVVDAIRRWRDDESTSPLHVPGTTEHYRVIVHVVYVWLCNRLGPVDADRMLSAAVRTAETLPDAVNHPPRELL